MKGTEGVLQVFLNEKERILLVENENLVQPHLDLLECFAEFLGMLLCHLRQSSQGTKLYKEVLQLKEEMSNRESFVLIQIRWNNFYECAIQYTQQVEALRSEITKISYPLNLLEATCIMLANKTFFC